MKEPLPWCCGGVGFAIDIGIDGMVWGPKVGLGECLVKAFLGRAHVWGMEGAANRECHDSFGAGFFTGDAAGFDPSIDPSAVALILERARLFLPALPDASAATVRVGLRPACAAGVPAVGAVPGAEGLFVAAGHEGSGLLLAPATARLLVRAVLKEEGGGRDAAIHAAADAVSPQRVLEAVEKRRKEETV